MIALSEISMPAICSAGPPALTDGAIAVLNLQAQIDGLEGHGTSTEAGTLLDLLILRTLQWGPTHGHGIAKSIERMSEETLKVEHGSLYPALQRMQQDGWITAEWGVSKNNQRAKYYRLTALGRRQLVAETSRWERFVRAVTGVLRPEEGR